MVCFLLSTFIHLRMYNTNYIEVPLYGTFPSFNVHTSTDVQYERDQVKI